MTDVELTSAATRLFDVLSRRGRRIVFAESCTAGLVSAVLARVPGVSRFHCGSAVVYRNATKSAWLKVSEADLADPAIGPVSEPTARGMALGVLNFTPEADYGVSITGHLGPDAPLGQDGLVFVGIATRARDRSGADRVVLLKQLHLPAVGPDPLAIRHERQQAAAWHVLTLASDVIDHSDA